MKKVIRILKHIKESTLDRPYSVALIDNIIAHLETPRWETPGEYWERTGEPYPDNAPVWETSKYSIKEKPSKNNRIRWYLQRHEDAIGGIENILLCAYNHLGPPPDDWRPE